MTQGEIDSKHVPVNGDEWIVTPKPVPNKPTYQDLPTRGFRTLTGGEPGLLQETTCFPTGNTWVPLGLDHERRRTQARIELLQGKVKKNVFSPASENQ